MVGADRQLAGRTSAVCRASDLGRPFPSLAVSRSPPVAVGRTRDGGDTRVGVRERVAAWPEAHCLVGRVIRGAVCSRRLQTVDGGQRRTIARRK